MDSHDLQRRIEELLTRQGQIIAEGRYEDICQTEKEFLDWGKQIELGAGDGAISTGELVELLQKALERNLILQREIKDLQLDAVKLLTTLRTAKSDHRLSKPTAGCGRLINRLC